MAGSCALISNGLSRRARWPLGTAGSPTPSAYFRREYITVVAVFCRDVSLRNTRLPPAFHLALPTCPLRANRPVACYNSSAKFNEIKKESPAQAARVVRRSTGRREHDGRIYFLGHLPVQFSRLRIRFTVVCGRSGAEQNGAEQSTPRDRSGRSSVFPCY